MLWRIPDFGSRGSRAEIGTVTPPSILSLNSAARARKGFITQGRPNISNSSLVAPGVDYQLQRLGSTTNLVIPGTETRPSDGLVHGLLPSPRARRRVEFRRHRRGFGSHRIEIARTRGQGRGR